MPNKNNLRAETLFIRTSKHKPMVPNDDELTPNNPQNAAQSANAPAGGYKVEDDDNLDEKDLKRSFLFGDSKDANPDQKGYESHGMGGETFGEHNVTTSGDDPANPSRTAGYTNDYFKRNEPLEEHPENLNFTPEDQEGKPDANLGKAEEADFSKDDNSQPGGNDGEAQKTQEGTVDSDRGQIKGDQKDDTLPNTSYYTGTPDYDKPDND